MAKQGGFFVRLCYGYVGKYKDTSKMTAKEVIEEFLKRKGVSSPREFFQKRFVGLRIREEDTDTPITPITEEAINRVQYIDIPGYTKEQCQYIVEQHKELLRYARDNNNNGEVAFVFRQGLGNKTIAIGTDGEVDISLAIDGKGTNIVLMHNHPRNSGFSSKDIIAFMENDISIMSIVKNNGKIEIVSKTKDFDFAKCKIELKREFSVFGKKDKYSSKECKTAIERFLSKNLRYVRWIKK